MRIDLDMEQRSTQTNVPGGESAAATAAREHAVAALGRLEHGQRDAMDELREALCGE